MITKIRMKNWKSHLDSELTFSKGVNGIVGIMGSGKSLPYDEIILVKKSGLWGKRKIGDVVEEQFKKSNNIKENGKDTLYINDNPDNLFIQSLDPKTLKMKKRKITGFIKHKSDKNLLKIKTRSGRRITITKDHSLLIFNDGKIIPCEGSDIKIGDFLPCAKSINFGKTVEKLDIFKIVPEFRDTTEILGNLELVKNGFSCRNVSKSSNITRGALEYWNKTEELPEQEQIIAKHLKCSIPKSIVTSDHFAKISGAYVSEGHSQYNEKKYRYGVKITNNDKKFIEEVRSSWMEVFPNISCNYINNDLQMNGKVISAFFKRLFGSNSDNKYIPDTIYGFDDEKLSNFLMMYFEGDGWVVPENNELAFCSKSIELVDGLITLLSKWGIISVIHEKKIDGIPYYNVKILPKHIPIFAKCCRFLTNRKQKKLENLAESIGKRKRWDGIDIIPNIKNLLHSLILEYHLSTRNNSNMRNLAKNFRMYMDYENIGREKLRKSLKSIFKNYERKTKSFIEMERIVESDIFFDKVIEVNEIPSNCEYVYDLSVNGTENFVAGVGNIIAHNSSIMQAISFALYGTFSGLGSRRVGIDDLIMSKPQQKSSAEVEMEFMINGKKYTVKRRIDQGKGTKLAEIREDSKMLEVNPQGVTNQVTRILQTDYDLFSRAVYSEQNGLDYFLNIPKGKRMAQIDGMLKLDLYEKARENSVKLRNRLSSAREEKVKVIEDMKSKNLEEKIENMTKEIETKKKEMETTGREYEKIKEERSSLLEAHEKTMKDVNAFRESISELNGKMMFLKRQNEEFRNKKEETAEKQKKLDDLRKILGEKPEEMIEKMKKEIDRAKEILHRNHALSEQASKSLDDLGGVKGKCPVCESELSKEKRDSLIKQRKESISRLSVDIGKLKEDIERKGGKLCEFSEKYEEFRDLSKSLKEFAGHDKKIEENMKEMEKIRKEVAGIANEIGKIESGEKEASEKLSGINEKFGEIRSKKDALHEMIEDKESVLSDLRKDHEMFTKYREDVERFREIDENLSKFTDVLRITQDQLRDEFLKTVNYIMNSVWSELYPYGDFTEIQLAIDNDYVLQLKGSRGWTSVDLVSGGERTLASLTLRVAFSLAFTPNLRWLILDEPTHNLDKNAIRHFGNILKDKMGDFIDQVFLITHEESLSDYITGSLYKMERNKEMDGVTRVIAV